MFWAPKRMGYYHTTGRERVVELEDFPKQCPGAPLPLLLSKGGRVVLSYLLFEDWDEEDPTLMRDKHGNVIGFMKPKPASDRISPETAFVCFSSGLHMMGGPNDEVLSGHPLYKQGLGPYGVYEVHGSDLPKALERINSVHSNHDPKRFEGLRHLIFTFHDETFECVTYGYEIRVESLPQPARLARMCELLNS